MPNPIHDAASQLGGQASLARALGVAPPTVNQWATGERTVPEERSAQIERLTGGAVTVEELRADARWRRVPDPDWPHPLGRPLLDVGAPKNELLDDTSIEA